MTRLLLAIFLLYSLCHQAQDKLYFKNGAVTRGTIVSMGKDIIYFKASDTSAVQKIDKAKLIMLEDYKGTRYLYSSKMRERGQGDSLHLLPGIAETKRNIFSLQPLGILVGRANFLFERLSSDGKIGIVLPLTLTFDPFGAIYNSPLDTNKNAVKRISGINFITGLDVNFYLGKGRLTKFFLGPRFRYGTDLFLRNIEGFTLQTQFGWKLSKPTKKIVQHLSLGLGFVRILSSPAGQLIDPRQSYAWYSLNYRIGVKW